MGIIDDSNAQIEKFTSKYDQLMTNMKQKEEVNTSLFAKNKQLKTENDVLTKQMHELKNVNRTEVDELRRQHQESMDKIHD